MLNWRWGRPASTPLSWQLMPPVTAALERLLERGFDALNLWQADTSVLYWEQFFSGPVQRTIEDDAACSADADYVITGMLAVEAGR